VADVFTEESAHHGEANTVGAELGFRYQITRTIVWGARVGTEFPGPAGRSRFIVTRGLSFGSEATGWRAMWRRCRRSETAPPQVNALAVG
jgi:hypothetical protein